MKHFLALLALIGLGSIASAPTSAQQWLPGGAGSPIVCAYNNSPPTISPGHFVYAQCTNDGFLQVNASVSASISGFTPTPAYATGTTSASDQNVALPTGTEFILTNTGTAALAWNIAATATGSMNVLQPSSWIAFAGTTGAAFHYIEATGASTSTFSISGGAGLPTGAGGGSSSGGGGGPATIAAGADVTEGNITDTAWTTGNGTVDAILKRIANNTATASTPSTGTPGQSAVSIPATGSTLLVAAAACTKYMLVKVNATETSGIWIRWDGATATVAAGAEYLVPGESKAWTAFVPSSQVNAIAATGTVTPVVECN